MTHRLQQPNNSFIYFFIIGSSTSKSENGKPTLKSVKYMMLPIYWDGEDTADPTNAINLTHIDTIMEEVKQYYIDMSWGKLDLQ